MAQLVSVVMPAYNAGRYIAESIRSVQSQTYPDLELVVVDDGSTDDTAEVVRGMAAADARIRYVYQPNGRLGRARNNGVAHSRGGVIAFLDSDDLWLERKLERQLKAFDEAGADLVFTDGFVFKGDDTGDESQPFNTPRGRLEGPALFDLLFLHNHIPVLSVALRRELWEGAGGFEEAEPFHGAEDYDLWLRLAGRGAVFYGLGERLVRYRRHASAMTHLGSRQIAPVLPVLRRHMGAATFGERGARRRVREMHRELISALVREGSLPEARASLEELRAWEGAGVVNSLQRLLIRLPPGAFEFVSREFLYRAEWHLGRVFGRLSSAHGLHP